MSEKYIAILFGVLFVIAFGGISSLVIDSYMKDKCRQSALKENKSAEEIQKICR